jgi:hypothetical protein
MTTWIDQSEGSTPGMTTRTARLDAVAPMAPVIEWLLISDPSIPV